MVDFSTPCRVSVPALERGDVVLRGERVMNDMIWNLYKWSEVWCNGMCEINALKWFGHLERKKSEGFIKRLCEWNWGSSEERRASCRMEGCGKGVHAWKKLLVEGQARKECMDRERWRLFCCGHHLGWFSCREWECIYSNYPPSSSHGIDLDF